MATSLQTLLKINVNVNGHISHPKKYTDNTYRLDFGGSRQVLRFCEWIYKDATIYLDRKHELYSSYKKTHTPRFKEML